MKLVLKMTTSLVFLAILVAATAANGITREERELHPDDKRIIDGIRKELNNLQTSLQNKHCNMSFISWAKVGSVYTRWGRSSCPAETELLYKGRTAGSHFSHHGGAANTLCLPLDPDWYTGRRDYQGTTFIYGAEYEVRQSKSHYKENSNYEIPCAVCRTMGKPNIYMTPAKTKCKKGWHMEYRGYLMAGHYVDKSATEYLCMDEDAEKVGSASNKSEREFFSVRARCGSLPCQTYGKDSALACVVCSL